MGHRRSRRVHEGEAYDVLLRVVGRAEMEGRWEPASQASPTQLHEYWRQMEAQGSSIPIQSSSADLHACRDRKTPQRIAGQEVEEVGARWPGQWVVVCSGARWFLFALQTVFRVGELVTEALLSRNSDFHR